MPDSSFPFLAGGGDMGRRVAAHDWSATPLGPIQGWSSALKVAVSLMLNSSFPKCLVWGPELVTIHNDAFRPILGQKPDALGRSFAEVWAEVWSDIAPIADRAFAGEATFINDFPLVIDRTGTPEEAFFTFCYSPIRDEEGVVRGMMDTVIETSDRVTTERRQRLLGLELAHRMKNVLAVVQGIVAQTLRRSPTMEEARLALAQRIEAMVQASDALTRSGRGEASIREVIDGVLVPHGASSRRIAIAGPEVWLPDKLARTLALAVNELATNAAKYGALSVESGQVDIAWRLNGDTTPQFEFDWLERGGPAVAPSSHRGFGSQLIEEVVAADFQGSAKMLYPVEGLQYRLRTEAAHLVPPAPQQP